MTDFGGERGKLGGWEARERMERKEGREGGRKGKRKEGREGKRKQEREGGRKATLYVQKELNVQLFVPISEEGFQGPPMTKGSLYQGTAVLD